MFFQGDLENLDIFTSGEFSHLGSVVSQTALKSQISGIFDERHEPMLDMYSGVSDSASSGKRITFKVKTSDVDGLLHGDTIAIGGSNYSVTGINAIGDGKLSELVLKQTAFLDPAASLKKMEAVTPGSVGGESIAQYRVVTVISGLFYLADNNDPTRALAVGIMQQNVSLGSKGSVLWSGYVRNPDWNFDPSLDLFLGSLGKIVQTPDLDAYALVELGRVISPTEILLNIKDPIYLK